MGEFEQNRESVNEKASRIVKAVFHSMKDSKLFLPSFKEKSDAELEKMCPALFEAVVELINDGEEPDAWVVREWILPRMFHLEPGSTDGSPETFFAKKWSDLDKPEENDLVTRIAIIMKSNV